MRLNWKILRHLVFPALLLVLGVGCSGINMSKSVSPASFFIPGLFQVDPPKHQPDMTLPAEESEFELAQF